MNLKILEGMKEDVAPQMVDEINHADSRVHMLLVLADQDASSPLSPQDIDAVLAEMDAHTVHVGDFDDSREAIYTRLENE